MTASTESPVENGQAGGPVLLANGLHALSCVTCAKRKVKCDRTEPCNNCTKHNIACEYREAAPKGRKRKAPDQTSSELRAKVEFYENLLASHGFDVQAMTPDSSVNASVSTPDANTSVKTPYAFKEENTTAQQAFPGRLVVHRGKSRYVEGNMWANKDLWYKMGDEDADALLEDQSDNEDDDDATTAQGYPQNFEGGDLLLGVSPKSGSLVNLYPPEAHFSKYWQIYLANIHPITMIIHAPTSHELLLEAVRHPEKAHKDVECLLFTVMACAVSSIPEDECIQKFSERPSVLMARFFFGAKQSLINSKFLISSNFMVLQALYIYILAVRDELDPRAVWNLTGVSIRNAQRLGLHKDQSTNGLTPFEIEMRRRLWWQIVLLDIMSAQTAGTATPSQFKAERFANPANVNDSDLHLDMKEMPKDRIGATDMIFCKLRLKIFNFMHRLYAGAQSAMMVDGRWPQELENSSQSKEEAINEVERSIELDILRYCDVLNPVHYLVTYVARLILCKARFSAFHPRQYQSNPMDMTQETRDYLFKTALRVVEYDNAAHGERLMQRFLWHSHAHFQWSCLVHILDELKTRTNGELAEKAWDQIGQVYYYRPEISVGKKLKLPLYMAIHRMSLDAWICRENEFTKLGEDIEIPQFIRKLRESIDANGKLRNHSVGTSPEQYMDMNNQPIQMNSMGAQMAYQGQAGFTYDWGSLDPSNNAFLSNAQGPVDWSLFDTMINEEALQGFGASHSVLDNPSLQSGSWAVPGQQF